MSTKFIIVLTDWDAYLQHQKHLLMLQICMRGTLEVVVPEDVSDPTEAFMAAHPKSLTLGRFGSLRKGPQRVHVGGGSKDFPSVPGQLRQPRLTHFSPAGVYE